MGDYLTSAKSLFGEALPDEGMVSADGMLAAQAAALIDIAESLRRLVAELSPANNLETGGPLWAAEDEQPAKLPLRGIMPREDDDLPF